MKHNELEPEKHPPPKNENEESGVDVDALNKLIEEISQKDGATQHETSERTQNANSE